MICILKEKGICLLKFTNECPFNKMNCIVPECLNLLIIFLIKIYLKKHNKDFKDIKEVNK